MASAVLHIKDSYYFEVPKFLWRSYREEVSDFPEVWIRLDPDYQLWEGARLYARLEEFAASRSVPMPSWPELRREYLAWKDADHEHFGRPLDAYLEAQVDRIQLGYEQWLKEPEHAGRSLRDYIDQVEPPAGWFARLSEAEDFPGLWARMQDGADDVASYATDPEIQWAPEKIAAYNVHLSGKILIPQPFGELRNLYEAESGVCISRFMIVQVVVALIIVAVFSWLARRIATGQAPRGRFWNLLEVILLYFRDNVVRPALGGGHHNGHEDEHHDFEEQVHAVPGHGPEPHTADAHGTGAKPDKHAHSLASGHAEADRYVPVLWTFFLFILGCNLMGLVPWVGAPTGSFSVTTGLALVAFTIGLTSGMRRFGVGGYFLHFIPSLGDIPTGPSLGEKILHAFLYVLFILIQFVLMLIEFVGLCIKHVVLGIRLLANMVAGHLVLAAIMGLAFGAAAAATLGDAPTWQWGITAAIAILGSTAFNCLELFVAFLQAYIFTFLTALFIATSIHKH